MEVSLVNRRLLREHIFKIIFSYEFDRKEDFATQIEYYLEELNEDQTESIEYIRDKSLKIISLIDDIDKQISDKIRDWTKERIAKVEVALIRLAVFEIYYEDIPISIAINEAVELAKKFGGENSSSFVNGVLANIIKNE